MTLFVVNRYDEELVGEKNDEDANLQRLKELIEKRRQAKSKYQLTHDLASKAKKEETDENNDLPPNADEKISQLSALDVQEDVTVEVSDKKTLQFKVLGLGEFEKKTKVKRVLPYWLSHPTAISVNLKNLEFNVDDIKFLDFSLKKKLTDEGIQHLFPVQASVIPWLLEENKKSTVFWPRDMCVSAPTGSGKTLAYVLPIIQVLTNRVGRKIRALVILPVKELAIQVTKVFRQYCIGTNLKIALVTGSVTIQQEQAQLLKYTESSGWESEVDIMVCTAGRLVEHLQTTEGFSLKHLRFLVMDEADRIMDHIQNDWLHHLNRHVEFDNSIMTGKVPSLNFRSMTTLRRPPQKLFFSATLSQDPEKLKQWALFQPKLFSTVTENSNSADNRHDQLGKYTTPLELTEKYIACEAENRPLALYHLLNIEKCKRVLCFTNSAQSAHRLTILLNHLAQGEIHASEISASLNRTAREAVLKKFQGGLTNVLISTDALARGIDISDCDLVISYDPPKNIKTYIHRVGRTGRAGRVGTAVAVLTHTQLRPFQEMLRTSGKINMEKIEIPEHLFESSQENYNKAMAASRDQLNEESTNHITKVKALKRGRSTTVKSNSKKTKYNK